MKVKVIELDDRFPEFQHDEEKSFIGKTFEAFRFVDRYERDGEKYREKYALNLGYAVYCIPSYCCEAVEGMVDETKQHTNFPNGILLVEDGSVDIDRLEEDGFYVIPYRQGAKEPRFYKKY